MTTKIQDNLEISSSIVPVAVGKTFFTICLVSPKMSDNETQGQHPELATNFRICRAQNWPCVVDVSNDSFVFCESI
jgi:hypothetical protein